MKLCCDGEAEQPRFTESGRAFCPACHRPVQVKEEWVRISVDEWEPIQMVLRHRSDGVSSGTRLGIPNEVTGLK